MDHSRNSGALHAEWVDREQVAADPGQELGAAKHGRCGQSRYFFLSHTKSIPP